MGQETFTCVSSIGQSARCWYIFDHIKPSRQLQEASIVLPDLQTRKGGFVESQLLVPSPPARTW